MEATSSTPGDSMPSIETVPVTFVWKATEPPLPLSVSLVIQPAGLVNDDTLTMDAAHRMVQRDEDGAFVVQLHLRPRVYQYMYVLDGALWRYAADQSFTLLGSGRIVNYIEILSRDAAMARDSASKRLTSVFEATPLLMNTTDGRIAQEVIRDRNSRWCCGCCRRGKCDIL